MAGEALYGRDDEVRELFYLLAAERIVLLHSPSGAGKTSLIQAALAPRLLAEGFRVLPLIRVGAEPPAELPGANRYLLATLLALEEGLPAAERRPPAELASLGLAAYLAGRPDSAGAADSEVLIFDQFEEVLTSAPADEAARAAFFAQLGAALRDRRRWALFAIREEYVAALERLTWPVPTRLRNTFQLRLLGPDAAMRAMQGPARAAGVEFHDAAARHLADDLRRASVQRPDGSAEAVLGQTIEPVQLQVVCLRLWESLPPGAREIDEAAVAALASPVDRALRDYYAERARAVAAASGLRERAVRDWCEQELITSDGLRSQVRQQAEHTAGLPNAAIAGLIDARLVRAEQRQGGTWFELAHDRLIDPVLTDNRAWRREHLSLLQQQAALWESQRRPADLLLSGDRLSAQEALLARDPEALTPPEAEFLEACRAARAAAERAARELAEERRRAERERRRLRQISALALVAAAATLIAAALALVAGRQAADNRALAAREGLARAAEAAQRQTADSSAASARTAEAAAEAAAEQARREARAARAGELAARSRQAGPQGALLLAAAAARGPLSFGEAPPQAAAQALIDALAAAGGRGLSLPDAPVSAFALSPDGLLLAVAGATGGVALYDPRAERLAPSAAIPAPPAVGPVESLAFSPDGLALAVAHADGAARIYRVAELAAPPLELGPPDPPAGPLRLAYAAGGRRLVLLDDGRLWLADLGAPAALALLAEPLSPILSHALSPDGRWLAAGLESGAVLRWDLAAATVGPPAELIASDLGIAALAFSPDGRWLIAGGVDRFVRRWEHAAADPAAAAAVLGEHDEGVLALAVSPDGRSVASAGLDTAVRLWPLEQPDPVAPELGRHARPVRSLAFSPDGRWLASAGDDALVRLWPLAAPADVCDLPGHEGPAGRVAFAARGDLLVSQSADGSLRVWPAARPAPAAPLTLDARGCAGCPVGVSALALSPDGRTLAVGTDAGAALYDLGDPELPARRLPGSEPITELALGGAGRWLMAHEISGAAGGRLRLFNLGAPEPRAALDIPAVAHAALSADGAWLAVASDGGDLQLYGLGADDPGAPRWSADTGEQRSFDLAVASGGRWLALATGAGTLLWDTAAPPGPPRRAGPATPGAAPALLAFSPNGRWLAIGEDQGALLAWDLRAPDTGPLAVGGYDAAVSALAFSPDGAYLASSARGGFVVELRRVGEGGPALSAEPLRGHRAPIAALAFSPGGELLISGDAAGQARVWALGSGAAPLVLDAGAPLAAVALHPQARQALTGARDGRVRRYELAPAALVELACQTAGRPLSAAERESFFAGQPEPDPCAP